jgi:phosphoglycolate phosphatase-like HAD superfamily hydrolase
VIETLQDAGVTVAFTTGLASSAAEAVLHALGWDDRAGIVRIPADSGRGYPFPDLPLTAVLRSGATSVGSMVVVGTTASVMAAGIAAGAGLVVGLLTGPDDEETLSDSGADAVIGSIAELPALLGFDD